jgi:hypothetical protein
MSDPVKDGRDALDHWFGYPWYDAKSDGVRRVEVSQPWDINLPIGSVLQWTAWITISLLLAGVLYLLIRSLGLIEGRRKTEEREPAARADRIESLPLAPDERPSDLLAAARQCRERGDYARAIVYLFSHELLELDKHGRVHLVRGKTNRQYLREIGRWPPLRGLIEQTTLVFEDVFFGHHAIEQPAFEACWSRLDEFESLVVSGEWLVASGEWRVRNGA